MKHRPRFLSNSSPTSRTNGTQVLDAAACARLARQIRQWGQELGFSAIGISDTDLAHAEARLQAWLYAGQHGEMNYMAKHGLKRARPTELVAGTIRIISARMPYLPASGFAHHTPASSGSEEASARGDPPHERDLANQRGKQHEGEESHDDAGRNSPQGCERHPGERVGNRAEPRQGVAAYDWRTVEHARLRDPQLAVVSLYARGRDYHKVMRGRLQQLARRIEGEIGPYGYRVFSDSAPVMEVELAQKAGVGWRGKHTLLLHPRAGSLFFLGEIYVDIPLPTDAQTAPERAPEHDGAHCGQCRRCIDACPTGAIVAPYQVDARRCISYLTIELKSSVPEALRPLIGNRIYGCDDCQLVCPWNKFAQPGAPDFDVRNGFDQATLLELFDWSAAEFEARLAGSAIRRIGFERWQRNLAIALGNALRAPLDGAARKRMLSALHARSGAVSSLVREHVLWALAQADADASSTRLGRDGTH